MVEVQRLLYPLAALLKLLHHSHDVERVHGVDDGRPHRGRAKNGGWVTPKCNWPNLVCAPPEFWITVPSVFHHLKGKNWISINSKIFAESLFFVCLLVFYSRIFIFEPNEFDLNVKRQTKLSKAKNSIKTEGSNFDIHDSRYGWKPFTSFKISILECLPRFK